MQWVNPQNGNINIAPANTLAPGMSKAEVIAVCDTIGIEAPSDWERKPQTLVLRSVPAKEGKLYICIRFSDVDKLNRIDVVIEELNGYSTRSLLKEEQMDFYTTLLSPSFINDAKKSAQALLFDWGNVSFQPDPHTDVRWLVIHYWEEIM